MKYIIAFFTLLGINFAIWSIIGLIRYGAENGLKNSHDKLPIHSSLRWVLIFIKTVGLDILFIRFFQTLQFLWHGVSILGNKIPFLKKFFLTMPESTYNSKLIKPNEVAAIIPAHNEEMIIEKCIDSLKKIISPENIFVGSDASTDRTLEIVQKTGANVSDIRPNIGKANVLVFLLKRYELTKKYKAIIIVDADSELDKNYLKYGLPILSKKKVAAMAVHVKSKWQKHWPPKSSMLFAAYRIRLYRILQTVMRYGQTWSKTNVSIIIPGFASMYRSEVLEQIEINAPGLVIEDYNMTFTLHHKKLGKIAYSRKAFGYSQDPISLDDYYKQIKRWNLGFWQTVRRHGPWFSFFWLTLIPYIFEMIFFAFFMIFIPIIFLYYLNNSFAPLPLSFSFPPPDIIMIRFSDFLIGLFLIDYLLTVITAILEKKPIILIYGLLFIFLRYLDAFVLIWTFFLSFASKSDGRWKSPERQKFT